jgi:hypothetical protein
MFSHFSTVKTSNQSYDHLNPVIAPFQNVLESKNKYIKIEGNSASATSSKKKSANIQEITDYINHLLKDPHCSFNDLTVLNQYYQVKTQKKLITNIIPTKKNKEIKKHAQEIEETKTALLTSLEERKKLIDLAMEYLNPKKNPEKQRQSLENLEFAILKDIISITESPPSSETKLNTFIEKECKKMLRLMKFSESQMKEYTQVLKNLSVESLDHLYALLLAATEGDVLKKSKKSKMPYTKEEEPLKLAVNYPKYKILKKLIRKILENEVLQSKEVKIGKQAIKHILGEDIRFRSGSGAVKTLTFDIHTQPANIGKSKLSASSSGFPLSSRERGKMSKATFSSLSEGGKLTETKIMTAFKQELKGAIGSTLPIVTPMIDDTLYKISNRVEKGELDSSEALSLLTEEVVGKIKKHHSLKDAYDKDSFQDAIGRKKMRSWERKLEAELSKNSKIDAQMKREILSKIIKADPPRRNPLFWDEEVQGCVLDVMLGNWKGIKERELKSKSSLTPEQINKTIVAFQEIVSQDTVKGTLLSFFESLSPKG